MNPFKGWIAVTLVAAAFFGAIAAGHELVPDHLTPEALPLLPPGYVRPFPDTAEVLANALPQKPSPEHAKAAPAEPASRY